MSSAGSTSWEPPVPRIVYLRMGSRRRRGPAPRRRGPRRPAGCCVSAAFRRRARREFWSRGHRRRAGTRGRPRRPADADDRPSPTGPLDEIGSASRRWPRCLACWGSCPTPPPTPGSTASSPGCRRRVGLPPRSAGAQWSDVGIGALDDAGASPDPIRRPRGGRPADAAGSAPAHVGVARLRLDRALTATLEFRDLGCLRPWLLRGRHRAVRRRPAAEDGDGSVAPVEDCPR